jgi:hypothetical protein
MNSNRSGRSPANWTESTEVDDPARQGAPLEQSTDGNPHDAMSCNMRIRFPHCFVKNSAANREKFPGRMEKFRALDDAI